MEKKLEAKPKVFWPLQVPANFFLRESLGAPEAYFLQAISTKFSFYSSSVEGCEFVTRRFRGLKEEAPMASVRGRDGGCGSICDELFCSASIIAR